ncbi:MAG: hypothetical protein NC131_00330 [Roseburia sp.]|nr:hypothetical protein [Roseburia sp.]
MNYIAKMSQVEYERLLNGLAGAIRTQRRFITIIGIERVNNAVTRYKVKLKGTYYPYMVEENFTHLGNLYLNLGLVI